ncbi:BMP family lipoprotein [Rhizobium sp. LEGMi135b]
MNAFRKALAVSVTFAAAGACLTLPASAQGKLTEVKAAYIPCGQVNDGSWSQAGFEGMKSAKGALGKDGVDLKIDYSENLSPAKAEAAARDYASRGYQTVVLHCGTFADAAYNAGKDFPKTNFLVVVAPKSKDNVWTYIPAMQDISFVSGYLAAKMSKTVAVGVVASFNFSNVTWMAEGFRLGARYANPNVKTYSTYINSFDDAGKAKEAAQAELDSGADVILSATDQASRGVYSATEAAGALAIGGFSDQSNVAPKTVLASALADIPLLVSQVVQLSAKQSLERNKIYSVGMAGGIGVLAMNPALEKSVPADVKEQVSKLTDDIKSGRLKVPALSQPGDAESYDLKTLTSK